MTDPQSQPSHPPSEPRPTRRSFAEPSSDERPVRLQLIAALFVPFVLIAALLYLWRRPRADEASPKSDAGALTTPEAAVVETSPAASASAAPPPRVKVGEVRLVSCQGAGKKKTSPEQCDHLASVEQALVKAIESSASCLPETAGAGTVEYALDVSFARKKAPIALTLPRAGRTFKNGRLLGPCSQAVRAKLAGLTLEGLQHTHTRYKLSVTASYGGT